MAAKYLTLDEIATMDGGEKYEKGKDGWYSVKDMADARGIDPSNMKRLIDRYAKRGTHSVETRFLTSRDTMNRTTRIPVYRIKAKS